MRDFSTFVLAVVVIATLGSLGAEAALLDWIWSSPGEDSNGKTDEMQPHSQVAFSKIPFEITETDEKFLKDAQKYTSLRLSDLDSCQHKVILQVQTSCATLTEEELAKISVNLLNCQSALEGRTIYRCTSEMSVRQCTENMDANTWNAYHIISNRARAVCYAARNQQFRAMTELTVNKLILTAQSQVASMQELQEGQEHLATVASDTLKTVSQGNNELLQQQEKLQHAQRHAQAYVATNLRELTREKAIIAAGHRELAELAQGIKDKLDLANSQLSLQQDQRRENHLDVIKDLDAIQHQVMEIWERIDKSTQQLLDRHTQAAAQYEASLENLARINVTIHFLLNFLNQTRLELDTQLGWIVTAIGGAGYRLDQVSMCCQHILYLVVSMVVCAFLKAPVVTRMMLVVLIPLNMLVSVQQTKEQALDFTLLTVLVVFSAIAYWLFKVVNSVLNPIREPCLYIRGSATNGHVRTETKMEEIQINRNVIQRLSAFRSLLLIKVTRLVSRLRSTSRVEKSFSSGLDYDTVVASSTPVKQDLTPPLNDGSLHPLDDFDVNAVRHRLLNGVEEYMRTRRQGSPARSRSGTPLRSGSASRSTTPLRSDTPKPLCRATCRNGQPCRNPPSNGLEYCYKHANPNNDSFRSSFSAL